MKTSMTIERLEQVVRVLKELPPEKKFDLGGWMKCGTTGCAIGWAASDPWFTRRGLKLIHSCGWLRSGEWCPQYRGQGGVEMSLRCFFGMGWDDINYLFFPGSYPAPNNSRRHVIARINKYVQQLRSV